MGSLLCSRKTSDIIEINGKKAHGPNLSKHIPQWVHGALIWNYKEESSRFCKRKWF